jgi:hypothetical protein
LLAELRDLLFQWKYLSAAVLDYYIWTRRCMQGFDNSALARRLL